MKIKTFISMVCLSVFFLLPGLNQAQAQSRQKKGFALKFTGGMSYLVLGDWYNHIKEWTGYLYDYTIDNGGTMEGEFKSIRWGLDFEGDVIFFLNPRFGITFGSGFISGKKGQDGKKITLHYPIWTVNMTHDLQVSAIPVKIGVHYYLYNSSKFRFFTSGGIGYYFSKMSEESLSRIEGGIGQEISTQDAKGEGIGFHGGMGFELDIAKSIAFVVEGYGRYAKIKGLKGEKTSDYYGMRDSMKGTLYYYELDSPYGWFAAIGIYDEVPGPVTSGGINRRNVREAALDFSGFTVRIGVKIRLF